MHAALWARLDNAGHDACRITPSPAGWTLAGTAVFDHLGSPACLAYTLRCDARWASTEARVTGWLGTQALDLHIAQQAGRWFINGQMEASLTGLQDIDLGFTPASNTNAIRRLNLKPAEAGESVAVWLDTEDWRVKALRQTYQRLDPHTYDYASPQHGYRATLTVNDAGLVLHYPGLWRMVSTTEA